MCLYPNSTLEQQVSQKTQCFDEEKKNENAPDRTTDRGFTEDFRIRSHKNNT